MIEVKENSTTLVSLKNNRLLMAYRHTCLGRLIFRVALLLRSNEQDIDHCQSMHLTTIFFKESHHKILTTILIFKSFAEKLERKLK